MAMTDVTRRQYMGGVAALAATRWENEDYDIENADEWEPLKGGIYETGTFTPAALTTSGDGKVAGWLLEGDDFSERAVEVFYDPSAVHLSFEGSDGDLRAGGLAELTTEQARELAAALFQAAEELDRRPGGNDADE